MAILCRHVPFDGMAEEHLRWVAEQMQDAVYDPGSVLIEPNQMCDRLRFIYRGTLRVEAMGRSQHDKVLAVMGEGACFPIEALHEERPLFSTFRVTEELWCWELSLPLFHQIQQLSPHFRAFCDGRSATLLEQARLLYQKQFAYNRIDRQSLDSPLSTIIVGEPQACVPDTPLRAALRTMGDSEIDTIVVVDEEQRPIGIFTLNDLLNRVALADYDLNQPIRGVMTTELGTLPAQARGSEAAMLMASKGYRQVLVVEGDRLVGLVHERDLFGLQRVGLGEISGAIRRASNLEGLKHCAADI
ncbi:MAG: CBS domain-containing protein [Alphaproteobacteria bacterium]